MHTYRRTRILQCSSARKLSSIYIYFVLLSLVSWTLLYEGLCKWVSSAFESVCGFCMNLYFIKISSASFNEWLFPLCAVELLKFSARSCQFCLGRCSTCPYKGRHPWCGTASAAGFAYEFQLQQLQFETGVTFPRPSVSFLISELPFELWHCRAATWLICHKYFPCLHYSPDFCKWFATAWKLCTRHVLAFHSHGVMAMKSIQVESVPECIGCVQVELSS